MQLTDVIAVTFIFIVLIVFSGEFLEFILFGAIGLVVMLAVTAIIVVVKLAISIYRLFTGK